MELLTTAAAARLLGVGTTSIKRWAEQGLLRCVKTPGGHRRYPREQIESLGRRKPPATGSRLRSWMRELIDGDGDEIVARLRLERSRAASWAAVADRMGPVIAEIGEAWARGEISVIEEHVSSDRLARALARCAEALPLRGDAPCALLITAEGEEHTLGLSLLELCLRERGFAVLWSGRRSPIAHVEAYLRAGDRVRLVGVSASAALRDDVALRAQAEALARICAPRGIRLLLGGGGAWPVAPRHGEVIRRFTDLRVD